MQAATSAHLYLSTYDTTNWVVWETVWNKVTIREYWRVIICDSHRLPNISKSVLAAERQYMKLCGWLCCNLLNLRTGHQINQHKNGCLTKPFAGAFIDTGAALRSSASLLQFEAYWNYVVQNPSIYSSRAAACHFHIVPSASLGIARIAIPIGNSWFSSLTIFLSAHLLQ